MADKVPYTGAPTVAPEFRPESPVHVEAPGAAFGLAEAEATARFGGAMQQASNELFSRAAAMQQLDQHAEATLAVGKFSDATADRLEQYRRLEGKAAADGYQSFKQDIDKIREETGGALGSPYAQSIYLSESRRAQSGLVMEAGRHAGSEFRKHLVGAAQASVDSSIRAISSDPRSEETFNSGMKNIGDQSNNMKNIHGWGDAEYNEFISKHKSMAVAARAEALGRIDPGAAIQLVSREGKAGNIDGTSAGKVMDILRNEKNNVIARNEGASIIDGKYYYFGKGEISPLRTEKAFSRLYGENNWDPPHPEITHEVTVNGAKTTITEQPAGKFAIMPSKFKEWISEANRDGALTGNPSPNISREDFIADHTLQQELFKFKFGQYQRQLGSFNAAAVKWFGDQDAVDKFMAGDEEFSKVKKGPMSGPEYLRKLNKFLVETADGSQVSDVAREHADKLSRNDPELADAIEAYTTTKHSQDRNIERESILRDKQKVITALLPGEDGKLKTSFDDIIDPDAQEAYRRLLSSDPQTIKTYATQLAANAGRDYGMTEENQKLKIKLLGQIADPTKDANDEDNVWNINPLALKMPMKDRIMINNEKNKEINKSMTDTALAAGIKDLDPLMRSLGIVKGKKQQQNEDYFAFIGALKIELQEWQDLTKKPIPREVIKEIGTRLLQEVAYPPENKGLFDRLFGVENRTLMQEEMTMKDRQDAINLYKNQPGTALTEPDESVIKAYHAALRYNALYGNLKPANKTLKGEK